MSQDLLYVVLIFALFVVPKFLQRYRIPGAITSLALGAAASFTGVFDRDATISLLATLGISALFLFAGLEVNFGELKKHAGVLSQHLAILVALLAGTAWCIYAGFGLDARVSLLAALALTTPSTGFILDSLHGTATDEETRFWIKSKAVAAEILALAVLFFALQSTSLERLVLATLALAALVFVIPFLFRTFAALIAPYAPRSEFAFLLMVAVLCAFATKKLGVYYLVGAFLVGLAARRFRDKLPAMTSERMLHAVEAFASVFTPFYFFNAGLKLEVADFGPYGMAAGAVFAIVLLPVRAGAVALHRRLALGEPLGRGVRFGIGLLPSLVFTMVLAEILRDRFHAPKPLFGGLIVYTLVNSIAPGIALRAPAPDYESPHMSEPSPDPNPPERGAPPR
jgi:Kef-type K+ transport system membrane component KefB